jgi:hypothetical protein
MWICPNCGEPHDDQFKECWKCASAQVEQHVTASPAMPKPERKLRSFGSILLRAALAFLIGTILGGATFHSDSLSATLSAGLLVGLVFGLAVGLFIWVCYPYEPGAERHEPVDNDEGEMPVNHFG